MRFIRRSLIVAGLAFTLCVPATAAATWSSYVGPSATFRQPSLGGPTQGNTGWNYWTDNRVYRPTPHPFYLDYFNTGSYHVSATNWDTNPFYFAPFGYSYVGCHWVYSSDGSSTLYPVTCQVFI